MPPTIPSPPTNIHGLHGILEHVTAEDEGHQVLCVSVQGAGQHRLLADLAPIHGIHLQTPHISCEPARGCGSMAPGLPTSVRREPGPGSAEQPGVAGQVLPPLSMADATQKVMFLIQDALPLHFNPLAPKSLPASYFSIHSDPSQNPSHPADPLGCPGVQQAQSAMRTIPPW